MLHCSVGEWRGGPRTAVLWFRDHWLNAGLLLLHCLFTFIHSHSMGPLLCTPAGLIQTPSANCPTSSPSLGPLLFPHLSTPISSSSQTVTAPFFFLFSYRKILTLIPIYFSSYVLYSALLYCCYYYNSCSGCYGNFDLNNFRICSGKFYCQTSVLIGNLKYTRMHRLISDYKETFSEIVWWI